MFLLKRKSSYSSIASVDSVDSASPLLPQSKAKEEPQKESGKLTQARQELSKFAHDNHRYTYNGTKFEFNDICKELGLINALITRLGKENESGSYTEEISNLTTKAKDLKERIDKAVREKIIINNNNSNKNTINREC
jgi:hypothetical protein